VRLGRVVENSGEFVGVGERVGERVGIVPNSFSLVGVVGFGLVHFLEGFLVLEKRV